MNFGTDNELVEQLYRVTHQEQNLIQAGLKAQDLNILQARALVFIAQHPGTIQRELSAYLAKPSATTTNILKVLEAKQLISRRIQADNERQKQLFLLPAGQALISTVQGIFADLEAQITAPLSPEEAQMMLGLLRRINQHLKA